MTIYLRNGSHVQIPEACDVQSKGFPLNSNHFGYACFDKHGRLVAHFSPEDVSGFRIHRDEGYTRMGPYLASQGS